ncbi:glycosyltransferase [Streptococcus equinus]|uniref:glycosyltransferase n=1 Tax=Streptococcus equinus TaxID=1335 RepID=UPI003BF88F99
MIVGLVAMYMPSSEEIKNIERYIDKLDYCYLLDDSATDNSKIVMNLIKKFPNKVEYYCNASNMGLCASVNNGFKMAIEKGADWVLVMNPDGTFQDGAIDIFRNFINSSLTDNIAIIAPRYNIDRRKRVAGKGITEIKYPDMTGCLYNAEILEKLDYYDNNTYFYGLDVEYCIRVRKKGYKIIECCEAVLDHQPAETYDVRLLGKTIFRCGKDTPKRFYYQFRSAYYINQKYHNFYNFLFHIYKFLKVVFFFDNKKEYLKMIKLGIKDAKRGFYGNINER